jgi:hypothetical protein
VWEYDVIFIGDPGSAMGVVKAKERLQEAGKDGWELVSYVEGYGIFKRSKIDLRKELERWESAIDAAIDKAFGEL